MSADDTIRRLQFIKTAAAIGASAGITVDNGEDHELALWVTEKV